MQVGIIDLIAGSVILLSIIISWARGLIKEVISLLSWLIALFLSIRHAPFFAQHITFTQVYGLRLFVAFLLIFVSVIFIGVIINFFVNQLVHRTPLRGIDRLLGMFFGFARGVLILSMMVLLGGLTSFPKDSWWQESFAIHHLANVAIPLKNLLPKEIGELFDLKPAVS